MKPKEFARLVARDGYCLHCGETEALSPNHRINRGMGGSKLLDYPSNYVLLCSIYNGLIESNPMHADYAHRNGWKLFSWDSPIDVPVFDFMSGKWFMLDNAFGRIEVEKGYYARPLRSSQALPPR